ncbi:MAG: dUTP diphosphatase [Solirubrobacteraceae bacterium]
MTPPGEQLQVVLLHPGAQPPRRGRRGDAGLDLVSVEAATLQPGERQVVGTGIALAIPPGLAGLVLPRSGLAARHGITTLNAPGLIDPNYRGECRVILHNAGQEPFSVQPGDRIAQLLVVPYWPLEPTVVEALLPSPDDRGADGFGSSGR